MFDFICKTACVAALLCACHPEDPPDPPLAQGHLQLTSDVLADTDVAHMLYEVVQVDCATGEPVFPVFAAQAVEDLVDAFLPGGGGLADAPLDGGSQHLFADHFFWLPEGCYDVLVQPLNADGEPSADCAPASRANVPVMDGQTTEIMLISQCANDPFGGLDVIAVINHAPQITGLTYGPSKFVCDEVEVCIEVTDPDNDPLSFSIEAPAGAQLVASSQAVVGDGTTVYCATYTFAAPGDYTFQATVHDLGWDADGDPVTLESLLEAQGDPLPSNDRVEFPVHVLADEACIVACACPEGFALDATGDACERTTSEPAQFNGATLEVCRGNRAQNYGALGARFPDGLTVLNPFFGSGFAPIDGRLNDVGIWACGPLGQQGGAQTQPVGEWIGFTRCVEVEAPGEYVVGIAADNQVRFRVDGVEQFSLLGDAFPNFRYWWMRPITLTPGTHIIEMEGRNNGLVAAFGAEIYGPFPPGSTADDAAMAALDYPNNILWSTGDQIASDFDTGTDSGYSCPAGQALDTCGGERLCTLFETAACE